MIVDRAFLREVTQTSFAVAVIVIGIFGVVRLVRLLSDAAAGDIPVDSVFLLLGLRVVTYFDVILPLVVYVAIVMVLSRYVRDNEMTVLHACGIGQAHFLRPGALLGIVLTLFIAFLSLYMTPAASRVSDRIMDDYRNRAEVSGVVPGVFNESRTGGIYYVEKLGEQADTLNNVFAYALAEGDEDEAVVVADNGYQYQDERTGDRFLVLQNGYRYEGNPGDPDYQIMDYETYALRIKTKPPSREILTFKAFPTLELARIEHDPRSVAELNWRFSKFVSVPVMVLMALAFGHINVRKSQLPRMIGALAMYFLYTNLLGYGHALVRKDKVDAEIGIWAVHLFFALIAAWLFVQRSRNRPLLPRIRIPLPAR